MAVEQEFESDVEVILSHRYDQGGDLWTTPDKRLFKGGPFSALESALFLLELGMDPAEPLLQEVADLFWSVWQEDGRFKVYPQGAIYPCQTAIVADLLCRMGYAADCRMEKTFQHLLAIQHTDGGLRCKKFSFGRGPETEYSNPLPTLTALNAFRHSEDFRNAPALDRAIEFLLQHWVIRKPIGPCHYGIGSLFMQVEYPFRGLQPVLLCLCFILLSPGKGRRTVSGGLAYIEHSLGGWAGCGGTCGAKAGEAFFLPKR